MITISFKGLDTVSWGMQNIQAQFPAAMASAIKTAASYLRPILARTTTTWNHKVKFTVTNYTGGLGRVGSSMDYGSIGIEADSDVWNMLDQGTRAHVIRAKTERGLMFFASGFQPKTKVATFNSFAGRKADADFRNPMSVNHPGTKARKWTDEATTRFGGEATDKAQQYLNKAFEAALRKEGRWASTDWLNSWGK